MADLDLCPVGHLQQRCVHAWDDITLKVLQVCRHCLSCVDVNHHEEPIPLSVTVVSLQDVDGELVMLLLW